MKRKFGNREGWPRIKRQHFQQHEISNHRFDGYMTILKFDEVIFPLNAKYTETPITLVSNGSYMVQHFPKHGEYCITTYLSKDQEVLQWYIDITDQIGLSDGIVYMDDLYLDLIVLPDYTYIEKDLDEFEDAYIQKEITLQQYAKAKQTFEALKEKLQNGKTDFIDQTYKDFKRYYA